MKLEMLSYNYVITSLLNAVKSWGTRENKNIYRANFLYLLKLRIK